MEPKFKTKDTELRSFDFEIRAANSDDKGDFIEGVPIVFEREADLGYYFEKIARGALDKTDLKDVRFLVNHNTDMTPLARSRNNNANSTMQMEIVDEGMKIRVSLDTENNSDARNLYSAVKRGDVTGMSFMFTTRGDKWDDLESEKPRRTITDIGKVFEVSAVTFPAYEQTSINARCQQTLESAKAALESAREEERKACEAAELRKVEENKRAREIALLDI